MHEEIDSVRGSLHNNTISVSLCLYRYENVKMDTRERCQRLSGLIVNGLW